MPHRLIVGCATGSSLDGLDVALVRIDGKGLAIHAQVLRCKSWHLGGLIEPLQRAMDQELMAAGEIAALAYELGVKHAAVIRRVIDKDEIDLICVHGLNVYHAPPINMQLVNVSPIATRLGIPVVYDLPAADLSCGGQGFPLTPIADHLLFRADLETRVVIHLGGFASFTWLPPTRQTGPAMLDSIRGGDICTCMELLNAISQRFFDKPFDTFGEQAMGGDVIGLVRDDLIDILREQSDAERSLGTGDEMGIVIEDYDGKYNPHDIARSACAAVAQVIIHAVGESDRIIVGGGGARNSAIMRELRQLTTAKVIPSDEYGIPAAYRDAIAMAVLGALCDDGFPVTLPQVTGVSSPAPLAGSWMYPQSWAENDFQ